MALHTIRLLNSEWQYDDSKPLGQAGGFGEVFIGSGECGPVAIKRLKINAKEAAHRELEIGQRLMRGSFSHIVPILDAGQDSESDRYFLVMPICEFSLQEKIDQAKGSISLEISKAAVNGILSGLLEATDITHRDLKPANILYHENAWKIADFGIAKFIEDSTSMETLRNCLTPTYAAPEQWKGERPTVATDIYSLGCIIHTLFTGSPPFNGSTDDVRENHLNTAPAPLDELAPRFSGFVAHMLRKSPNSRPTLDRCIRVLSELELKTKNSNVNHPVIDEAAKRVAQRESEDEARNHAAATLRRERTELFSDAQADLISTRNKLLTRLKESSESVKIDNRSRLRFGDADLNFTHDPEILDEFVLARHARGGKPYEHTGWNVLGWSKISLTCNRTSYTWSSSLLFADLKDGNGFRWYEVAFWTLSQRGGDEPYGIEGYKVDIDLACGNIMHSVNVAYGPLPIDGEDQENFFSRWMGLVAKAAVGELNRPNRMPITDFK